MSKAIWVAEIKFDRLGWRIWDRVFESKNEAKISMERRGYQDDQLRFRRYLPAVPSTKRKKDL